MLNLDKFPLEIGALKESKAQMRLLMIAVEWLALSIQKRTRLVLDFSDRQVAHFGTFSVKDEEEAIKIIKDFKVGDKKITDYSPYDDKDKIDPLGLEKKISNLEKKIAILENTIIDLEHRIDNINDRLEASYL